MIFARSTPAHLALSASVASQDIWLPDAMHCRFDASETLGFSQSPTFVTWAPLDDLVPENFVTTTPLPDWRFRRGSGLFTQSLNVPPASALGLEVTSFAPVTFSLPARAMVSAQVTIRQARGTFPGQARVFGIIETPGGEIRVAARRNGSVYSLAGRRFDYLLIETPGPRIAIDRITGMTEDGLWDAKIWQGIFRRDKIRHALTLDALFARSQRLSNQERNALRADPATNAALAAISALSGNASVAAPMPPLDGPLFPPGSDEARAHQATAGTAISAALQRLMTLIDAPLPQRGQLTQDQTQTASGSTATGQIRPLHELMLACEDVFLSTVLGRRIALPLPEPATGPVLVSARSIWMIPDADRSRLGTLSAHVLDDRAALRDLIATERLDPAGRVLEKFIPGAFNGRFLPVEARILIDPALPDSPPERPVVTPVDVIQPINPDGQTRSITMRATVTPGAALVADRGDVAPFRRLNPLEVKATTLPDGRVLPERYKPIFGMSDSGAAPLGLGSVRISDRSAGFEATPYRIAQRDGFGRWSGFTGLTVPLLERPVPPAPTLRLGLRRGAGPAGADLLDVEVASPHKGLIAPGGLPITELEINVPIGVAPQDSFSITFGQLPANGDSLPPVSRSVTLPAAPGVGEIREARVTAFFTDSAGTPGPDAVAKRSIADATPPPPPGPLPALTPLSFPDANGVTRAELTVTGLHASVAHLRVFVAQEASLRAGLERSGQPDLVAAAGAIAAEADLAARAALAEAVADRLPEDIWAGAGDVAVTAAGAQISHPVNGLPRDLVCLMIRTVTAGDIESTSGQIAFFGLPVPKPLAPPALEARMLDETGFEILIPRPAGPVPDEIRLMRSADSDDAARMLPVRVILTDDTTTWPLRILDRGETTLGPTARLTPYTTWRWRAQSRAAPRFNGAAPGPWTQPGPAARARIIPPGPPPSPVVTADRDPATPGAVIVTVSDLPAGSLLLHIASLPGAPATDPLRVTAPEMKVVLPPDPDRRAIRVHLSDPLGRTSDPVAVDAGALA
ncbi:hypothetical protein [uncultured Roseobacter sp.]|uniref:hypothetical protein n=1 Tax=uncultured Roseobacter sp. TaxID=114847 RepID=UPI0026348CD6|nr:hypothetical protein [uncultured Roseobacter sp.]